LTAKGPWDRFYAIATGKLERLDAHLEEYLATLTE
jgi:hypothetical protein